MALIPDAKSEKKGRGDAGKLPSGVPLAPNL
jgi:hypothetical protein